MLELAIQRVLGLQPIPPEEAPIQMRGAYNNFDSRGRGSASARRVLRDGTWQWFAPRASSGRYRSDDRHDQQYGDVWIGELLAEYTLGSKEPTPNAFYLVTGGEKPLLNLQHQRRRDGQYHLILPSDAELVVSNPTWR